MPTASAPGKVYLFGEHAVVYGEPAIPCAIDRRVTVTVHRRDDSQVRIDSAALTFDGATVEYGQTPPEVSVKTERASQAVQYIDEALQQAREVTGDAEAGFTVEIESELPIGAGLGSSAAVSVATIAAAGRACGETIAPATIADRGYRVEHTVQDGEASRADTYCSTMGGAVRVEGDDCRTIESPNLPLVIGYDGGSGDTGELVAGVRSLKASYDFADDTIGTIGDLVRAGEQHLAETDLPAVGELMNINHGLLSALGVSSRSLDAMVWAAREAGALGAKLTGAGGGGCIVALDPADDTEMALRHAPECEEVFRAPLADRGLEHA